LFYRATFYSTVQFHYSLIFDSDGIFFHILLKGKKQRMAEGRSDDRFLP